MQQRQKSAPTQTSPWGDPNWSHIVPGGSPYSLSMSEYPNVGSQQSQSSQLNTPPFPPRSSASAAAGSASQLPAETIKEESTAGSTVESPGQPPNSPEVETRPKKNREVTSAISIDD